MSNNGTDSEQRMSALAAAANDLKGLPVADQYRILAEQGLRLSDTGWKVIYDPDGENLQKHVTVIPVVKPQGA